MSPQSGFGNAAVLFGLRIGYSFIPGVAVATAERGVRWSEVDPGTQRRTREFYSSVGSTLPFTYASYVWGKDKGVSRGVSAPYFGMGFNPLHGRNAFVFIPGVFCFTLTSRGAVGVCMSPLRFFGFFFGGSIFVNHPALQPFTNPVLDRIDRVSKVLGRVLAPVAKPIAGVCERVRARLGRRKVLAAAAASAR
ncbi:MAG: hypothetical protein IPJ65_22895 [Archangiaceae bacterium]|nr:hypothetical protein [Archangiaceae bacterium]